jgi:hypothetical protein
MKNLKEKIDKRETFLLSIHIPKTGGTTFGKILSTNFGDSFLYVYPHEKRLDHFVVAPTLEMIHQNIQDQKVVSIDDVIIYIIENKISVVHGHFEKNVTLQIIEKLSPHFSHITTLAFVRDPVQRVISELNHYGVHLGIDEIREEHYLRSQNMLSRCINVSFPNFIICHTEQFYKDVQRLGFYWDGMSENITLKKEVYDTEKIKILNKEDIELYGEL